MGVDRRTGFGKARTHAELPLMVEVFPKLVAEIDWLLRLDDPLHPLIGTVGALRFHGRCTCTVNCDNLLTAPAGSSGPYLLQLERDGNDVIWLNLDPARKTVADIEVLDPTGLDLDQAESRRSLPDCNAPPPSS